MKNAKCFVLPLAVSFSAAMGVADADLVSGYYSWNWGPGSTGDTNATHSVAFTGLTDVEKAISGYPANASWCCPDLRGTRLLSLGGGNAAGAFNPSSLRAIAQETSISSIKNAGYNGVMFDVEEVQGSSSTTVPAFKAAFQACKDQGLLVGVTVSHSAPYQTDQPSDAVNLAKAFAEDSNIDFFSPQLYSSGSEAAPQFDETNSCVEAGCTWDLYKNASAAFVPSIVELSHYAASIEYFKANHSIDVEGYFVWKQEKTSNTMYLAQQQTRQEIFAFVGDIIAPTNRSTQLPVREMYQVSNRASTSQFAKWLDARITQAYAISST